MTLSQKLNRLPPCICRLLACREGELMRDIELMAATGWQRDKLRRVARAKTWDGIPVKDVDRFLSACGLTWSTQRRQLEVLKRATAFGLDGILKMRHLRRPIVEKKDFVTRLIKRTEKILREHSE